MLSDKHVIYFSSTCLSALVFIPAGIYLSADAMYAVKVKILLLSLSLFVVSLTLSSALIISNLEEVLIGVFNTLHSVASNGIQTVRNVKTSLIIHSR